MRAWVEDIKRDVLGLWSDNPSQDKNHSHQNIYAIRMEYIEDINLIRDFSGFFQSFNKALKTFPCWFIESRQVRD